MVDSDTHPSLHSNCYDQTIHCKINLQVEYQPPYQGHVWRYAETNKDSTLSALQNVDWHRFFTNKTVHQQANLLNIILNVFTNSVCNKVITCHDRDPPWINDNIKNKIKWKNGKMEVYPKIIKEMTKKMRTTNAASNVSELIEKIKDEYYCRLGKRLNDPSKSGKSYWTILKTFYNKRKIPLITLLLVNNIFVNDFKGKANLFKKNFCKQCTPVANVSTLQTLIKTPIETLSSLEIIASRIEKISKH